jgi:hypothetical protein
MQPDPEGAFIGLRHASSGHEEDRKSHCIREGLGGKRFSCRPFLFEETLIYWQACYDGCSKLSKA